MAGLMDLSWRHALLGLALGALFAGGALALAEWATEGPGAAPGPAPPAADADADHAMGADARCAHMPEHCPPTGGPA